MLYNNKAYIIISAVRTTTTAHKKAAGYILYKKEREHFSFFPSNSYDTWRLYRCGVIHNVYRLKALEREQGIERIFILTKHM